MPSAMQTAQCMDDSQPATLMSEQLGGAVHASWDEDLIYVMQLVLAVP